jgi:hypothetical protein
MKSFQIVCQNFEINFKLDPMKLIVTVIMAKHRKKTIQKNLKKISSAFTKEAFILIQEAFILIQEVFILIKES